MIAATSGKRRINLLKAMLVFTLLLMSSVISFAKEDNSNVKYTTRVWAGFIYGMVEALGPVNDFKKPDLPEVKETKVKKKTNKKVNKTIAKKRKPTVVKEVKQPAFQSKVLKFNGKQMWGTANVTIKIDKNSFDVKVKSTAPVSMWTLYSEDNTEIDSGRIDDKEVFAFNIEEMYLPPYTLYLNVEYMGMPNLIKIKFEGN